MVPRYGIDGLDADIGKGHGIQTVHHDMMGQDKAIGQAGRCKSLDCPDTSHLGHSYSADTGKNACIDYSILAWSPEFLWTFESKNLPLLSMIRSLCTS